MDCCGVFGEGEGFAAGDFEEIFVADGVGDVEAEVAGLAGAEKFAGAAEEEIGFGDFEAVGGADHGFEAGARFFRHADGADQDAVGFGGAAADASAELVELGQAEAFGVLDDHGGGVGDVDADFDRPWWRRGFAFRFCGSVPSRLLFLRSRGGRGGGRAFSLGKTSLERRSYSSIAAFSSSFDSSITG